MMSQPKKNWQGVSDLLVKTRFKEENDNLLALIIHKTRECKFKFEFNKQATGSLKTNWKKKMWNVI